MRGRKLAAIVGISAIGAGVVVGWLRASRDRVDEVPLTAFDHRNARVVGPPPVADLHVSDLPPPCPA